MIELSTLVFATFVGFITGLIFFGGLWFTTQRLSTWNYPAIWLLISFMVRASVMLGALYWVGKDHLPGMVACLVGFLIARVAMLHVTREKDHMVNDREERETCT